MHRDIRSEVSLSKDLAARDLYLEGLELQVDMYRERLLLQASRTGRNHFYAPSLVRILLPQAGAADMPTLPRSLAVVVGSSQIG